MNNKYQGYFDLIDSLLECRSGEEFKILNDNQEFIDAYFLELMQKVTKGFAKQNNSEMAQWLTFLTDKLKAYIQENSLPESLKYESVKSEANQLFIRGLKQFKIAQFSDALDSWKIARQLYNEINDLERESETVGNIGNAYYFLGDYEKAITYHQKDLQISRDLSNYEGEAYALNNLARVYEEIWQHQPAIESYQQSVILSEKIGDFLAQITALTNLGNIYNLMGKFPEAIDSHQRVTSIAKKTNNRSEQITALLNLGNIYDSLGKYEEAAKNHQESLAIAREIKNPLKEAISLNNLGSTYLSQGQYRKAIEQHLKAWNIQKQLIQNKSPKHKELRSLESSTLGNLGLAYHCLGQYQKAIEYQQKNLNHSQETGFSLGEATALGNLGLVYHSLGQYQKSIELYQQQLTITQRINDRLGEVTALGNLGSVYYSLQRYQTAIEYHQQSLDIVKTIGYRSGEVACLSNLGNVHFSQRNFPEAIAYQKQSQIIAEELGDVRARARSLGSLGIVYAFQEQYQEAINCYQQQLIVVREIGDRSSEGAVLNNLGFAFLKLGQLSLAENNLYQGIEIWESIRTDLGQNDSNKISIFDTQLTAYSLLQQVLVRQKKPLVALEVSERGRARALVDLLKQQLTSQEQQDRIASFALSITQIKNIAKTQNITLVEYSQVFDEELYIWVILPSGEINFRTVDLTILETTITNQVFHARQLLGIKDNWYDGKTRFRFEPEKLDTSLSPLQQLYQCLIEPIADLLPTDPDSLIGFIPQNILFLVPFSALQDREGKFLIEKHTITIVPSIQVLETVQKRDVKIKETFLEALIVGNPKMPVIPLTDPPLQLLELAWAKPEAQTIASFFRTQALVGANATKLNVVEKMPKARIIHLATHGLLNDIRQLGIPGAVALAPTNGDNGFLTAGEIYNMKLNAELVVLSACSTGQGKITGDGVIGLSRCLIAAGVKSLIVSLWPANDLSTALMMVKFYQIFQQKGAVAVALNEAQRWLLRINKTELAAWVKANEQFFDATLKMNLRRRLNRLNDSAKPFENSRHWAAFFAIGQ